jgi:hypothetical protein
MPRGYAKEVSRLRKPQEDKENLKIKAEREAAGLRYSQKKLNSMKPPTFLEREMRKKRIPNIPILNPRAPVSAKNGPVLLSIEVSISASRTAIINIREGDDLRNLASNFCRTYNLNQSMYEILLNQLSTHMHNYHQLQQERALQQIKQMQAKPQHLGSYDTLSKPADEFEGDTIFEDEGPEISSA